MSIIFLANALIFAYLIYCFNSKDKIPLVLPLCIILFFVPKINLLNISAMTTAGVRIDDFIIMILLIKYYPYNLNSNKILKKGINLLIGLSISNFISLVVCTINGVNPPLLYSILTIIRKIEYFSLIFLGFKFAKLTDNYEKIFLKHFTLLNIGLFLIGFLQVVGLCNYAVSGSVSANFFHGIAVSTFNGYYEFGQYLVMCCIIYLIQIIKSNVYIKTNIVMLLLSISLLILSNSRTSLITFVLIMIFIVCKNIKFKINIKVIYIIIAGTLLVGLFVLCFSNIDSLERFETLTVSDTINRFVYYMKHGDFEQYRQLVKENKESLMLSSFDDDTDMSTNIRFFKWGAAWDGFKKNILFGYGYGVTHVMDGNYFRLLGETGLIGTYLWLKLYFTYLKRAKKYSSKSTICYSVYFMMLSVLISATFIDMFDASKIMEFLWFMIGLAIYNIRDINIEIEKEGKND